MIKQTLVANVDLTDSELGEELTIRLRCDGMNGSWKSGLYFEGVVLVPDPSKGQDFERIR